MKQDPYASRAIPNTSLPPQELPPNGEMTEVSFPKLPIQILKRTSDIIIFFFSLLECIPEYDI